MPEETTQELMHIPTIIVVGATIIYFVIQAPNPAKFSSSTLISLFIAIVIADLITGIFYLILKKFAPIRNRFPILLGLSISALSLLSLLWCSFGDLYHITFFHAIIIGIAQACTLLPGISRLAITLVTAAWLGIDPLIGALFSLAIELPLILAAVTKAAVSEPTTARALYSLSLPQSLVLIASTTLSIIILIGVIILHIHNALYVFGCYLLLLILLLTTLRVFNLTILHR